MMLIKAFAIIISCSWILVSIYFIINTRRVGFLRSIHIKSDIHHPFISIIIPVRNEEIEVENALKTVLDLSYPNKEIIVINDRSTDNTPAILQRLSETYPSINLITIDYLQPGWLGKNHALYKGYLASSGEWLLFTDADVNYNKDVLKKSIAYIYERQLDHLVIIPHITSSSALFKSVMNTFAMILEFRLRPWNVSNPKSKASIGVGAFNLVKRKAYEEAGTHKILSLRPDDDLKLGEHIKRAGFRQDVLYGDEEVHLIWYNNLSEFINGLMKNTFSISNYNLPYAFFNAFLALIVFVLPIPLLVIAGHPYWIYALVILVAQTLMMFLRRGITPRWYDGIMMLFSGMIIVYIIIVSAIKAVRAGGIYWRDSFYSLKELRKQ